MRLEAVLLGVCGLCWLVAGALALRSEAAGSLPVSLYHLYGLGAFGGWLAGNVYVQRTGRLPSVWRRRVAVVYLAGPPGLLFLLHSLTPAESQASVPLAPVYASAIYAVLFLVPVSFRRMFGS